MNKNTICLWYNGDAEDAARFYAETFPDTSVGKINYAPSDYPDGKKGNALVVEFTVVGIPCIGLNGGPQFPHTEAFSFQIQTEDQAETDRYWNAIVGNGGKESECGWCKDKWGPELADHAAHLERSHGDRRRRGQTRLRGDDDDEKDRRRQN